MDRKIRLRLLCPWQVNVEWEVVCKLKGVGALGLRREVLVTARWPSHTHAERTSTKTIQQGNETQSGRAARHYNSTAQHSPLKTSDTHNLKGLSMERWGGLKESGRKLQTFELKLRNTDTAQGMSTACTGPGFGSQRLQTQRRNYFPLSQECPLLSASRKNYFVNINSKDCHSYTLHL